MRIRVLFSKTEFMRYTSHLDLYRAWERMLRRADLPLSYTDGIKPHPRINLASALPLGFTSISELVDIYLDNHLPIEYIFSVLENKSPPGIVIKSVQEVDVNAPKLQSQLTASQFIVTLKPPVFDLKEKINVILNAHTIPRKRRDKLYDLKKLIIGLEAIQSNEEGHQRIMVILKAQEAATGRPEEVVDELGGAIENSLFERVKLIVDS